MSEEELVVEAKTLSRWEQHRFMLLVGLAIATAIFLVTIALALYSSSGAAQLDLSRPGYQSVRSKASPNEAFSSFPATGELDKESIEEFRRLYDKQVKDVMTVDSFSGNVMSDQALSIDEPALQ